MLRSLIALALIAALTAPAAAFPEFQKQFLLKYADGSDSAFSDQCKEAKCFICHQGKKKDHRNPYGEALDAHLSKKEKKEVAKIVAALEMVASESSNSEDPDAPTFGELIAAGKLPGGTLEDCKKEPGVE